MDAMDHVVDSAVLLEAEIEALMRRLLDSDPNALLRIEKLHRKLKIERIVEQHGQRPRAVGY